MKLIRLDHVTINCCDKDAAFAFYENVLGLKRINEVDMGDHVLYYYQLPGITRLELIAYKDPQKQWETGNTDLGIYRHMALAVDDLNACFDACKKAGCKINMEPTYISQIDKTVMLVVDPNGVEIELIQA